ncbi:MAG: type II toxin-antitoxin system RelE/ParE family toxin [Candidatus Diapherotrites archaeon]
MWRLVFTPRARKDLLKIEKSEAIRIVEKLKSCLENPESHFVQLSRPYAEYWKLRVGDYRAIAVLEYSTQTVEVRRAGHRKNIYRQL